MSLLLDALKKSEAQRRRGKVPALDLSARPDSGDTRRQGSRWRRALFAGLVLGLVLVAALPWLWPEIEGLIDRPAAAGAEADGLSENAAAASSPARRGDAPAARSGSSATDRTEATPAQTRRATSAPSPGSRRVEPAPVAGAAVARRVAEAGSRQPEAEAVDLQTQGPASQDRAESRPATRDQQSEAAAQRRQAQSASTSQQAEKGGAPEAPEPETRENFIRPWELPQAARAEFPDLDLSVHFYAETPANRFVLINGERYREGQQVETGIMLAEIRRRGAVVEFGDYRVLIE